MEIEKNDHASEQPMKPAQLRNLVLDYLCDKRRSTSVFKSMKLTDLEVLSQRLASVVKAKQEEAQQQFEREKREKEKVDTMINLISSHLTKTGFKFNPDEIVNVLSKTITADDDTALSNGLLTESLGVDEHASMNEENSNVGTNVQ